MSNSDDPYELAKSIGVHYTPPVADEQSPPCRIGFLLIPGFSLLAYSSAVEPYRAANVLSGRELYRWVHVSPDGRPINASNGVAIVPDQGIERPLDVDELYVCAGGNPTHFDDAATLGWLRQQGRRVKRLGGTSGGPFILGRAGLLAGYRFTMHWEYIPAYKERYSGEHVKAVRYEIDRNRATASGATAGMEMMITLIAMRHGNRLGNAIKDWFVHASQASGEAPQRMSLRIRYNVSDARMLSLLERLETELEEPPDRNDLAERIGVSVRQLERLFQTHLGCSIGRHSLSVRLEHARHLLRQTSLSVLDIAVASGFGSAAHFSRVYHSKFGYAPRRERKVGLAHEPAQ